VGIGDELPLIDDDMPELSEESCGTEGQIQECLVSEEGKIVSSGQNGTDSVRGIAAASSDTDAGRAYRAVNSSYFSLTSARYGRRNAAFFPPMTA
jgi:hypothetical protein